MPVHVVPPLTTCWLLDHGADANQQDCVGRTPLDHLWLRRVRDTRQGGPESDESLYQYALALPHGGKRGHSSRLDWTIFVAVLEVERPDVSVLRETPESIQMEDEATPTTGRQPNAQIAAATDVFEGPDTQTKIALLSKREMSLHEMAPTMIFHVTASQGSISPHSILPPIQKFLLPPNSPVEYIFPSPLETPLNNYHQSSAPSNTPTRFYTSPSLHTSNLVAIHRPGRSVIGAVALYTQI